MAVYVDKSEHHGYVIDGVPTKSCHMFVAEENNLGKLHVLADRIGASYSMFKDKPREFPHYDLVGAERSEAIQEGAAGLERRQAREIINERRNADILGKEHG